VPRNRNRVRREPSSRASRTWRALGATLATPRVRARRRAVPARKRRSQTTVHRGRGLDATRGRCPTWRHLRPQEQSFRCWFSARGSQHRTSKKCPWHDFRCSSDESRIRSLTSSKWCGTNLRDESPYSRAPWKRAGRRRCRAHRLPRPEQRGQITVETDRAGACFGRFERVADSLAKVGPRQRP
jgi:hypothetical protein